MASTMGGSVGQVEVNAATLAIPCTSQYLNPMPPGIGL